jgi:hypothetical protein
MRPFLWLAFAGMALFGCEDNGVDIPSLAPGDYSIDQSLYCFCAFRGWQARVVVKSDTIAEVVCLDGDTLVSPAFWGNFKTIKGLFNEIAGRDTSVWIVEYAMDSTSTYPARLHVRHRQATDVGMTWVTSNLVVLPHLW